MEDVRTPFIKKLFTIFSKNDPSYNWKENGNILVNDIIHFSENIMPKYYKSSSITSFIRQLNMYGFTKKSSRANILEYNHPLFQKDKPELLLQITRKRGEKRRNDDEDTYNKKKQAVVLTNSNSVIESKEYKNLQIEMEKMKRDFVEHLSKLENSISTLRKIIENEQRIRNDIIETLSE